MPIHTELTARPEQQNQSGSPKGRKSPFGKQVKPLEEELELEEEELKVLPEPPVPSDPPWPPDELEELTEVSPELEEELVESVSH
jgi:hypothetical protein